jgi:hypothetical protein
MADSKISALTSASSLADTDVLAGVQGSNNRKFDLNALTAYFESRARQSNASVSQLSVAAADIYLTGSFVTIPTGRLQAKTVYRARVQIAKTSVAGTATPVLTVRTGTAGATTDTSRCALTYAAQTAVADDGLFEVFATFRTVGSGTSAVIRATGTLGHRLAATGLSTANMSIASATSAGFDSTTANLGIGLSLNMGTSFTGTVDLVQAELYNLA